MSKGCMNTYRLSRGYKLPHEWKLFINSKLALMSNQFLFITENEKKNGFNGKSITLRNTSKYMSICKIFNQS